MRTASENSTKKWYTNPVVWAVAAITLAIVLIPLLFWGHLYFVGGDDSKLFYMFPREYLKNFTFTLISDTAPGNMGYYISRSYSSLFVLILLVFKTLLPFLNVQLLMFGLNLGFGFLFFYLLLGIWIRDEKWYDPWIKISAGLMYTFSIFTFYSMWSHQLVAMYLVCQFPLWLYLFIRAVKERSKILLVANALCITLFSVLLLSVPWLAALMIAALPILFVVFWQHKARFIGYATVLLLLVFALNFYWIFHFIYAPISSDKLSSDLISHSSSSDFKTESAGVITSVSNQNQLFFPLLNEFHDKVQKNFNWISYDIFSHWHIKFLALNGLFVLIILIAGACLHKERYAYKNLYIASIISWLAMLFLFTVNVDWWGGSLFVWFNYHVPGFTMFRNMFDKFGLSLAFSYAFVFGVSGKIILDTLSAKKDVLVSLPWKKVLQIAIIVITIGITLGNAKPFVLGEYYKAPLVTTTDTYNPINKFNTDFTDLAAYIKEMHEPSRFLWLPMNVASYVNIQDQDLSNHYYSGISPLVYLADANDYTGRLSFPTNISNELFGNIYYHHYHDVGLELQRLNVRYIIVNNTISEDLQKSYLFAEFYANQHGNFEDFILGPKVKDFGNRYSLYRINTAFDNDKIYLTDDYHAYPGAAARSQVTYTKLSSDKYTVNISHLGAATHIVFLDPYHALWTFYGPQGQKVISGSHDIVYDYANGWNISAEDVKQRLSANEYTTNSDGSINVNLTLSFEPQRYFLWGLSGSFAMLLGCFGYVGFVLYKKYRRSKNA